MNSRQARLRLLKQFITELNRVRIMRLQKHQSHNLPRIPPQNIPNSEEIPQTLAHFFFINSDKSIVHPVLCERAFSKNRFTLRNLAFVMRERKIRSTSMNIELFAQNLPRHHTTFQVPTRPSISPRSSPFWFTLFRELPNHKIIRIPFLNIFRNSSSNL